MKTVFLDYKTVDPGDLDLSPLRKIAPNLILYDKTAQDEVNKRIQDAEQTMSTWLPQKNKELPFATLKTIAQTQWRNMWSFRYWRSAIILMNTNFL